MKNTKKVKTRRQIEQKREARAAGSNNPSIRRVFILLVAYVISVLFVWLYIGHNRLMPDQILYIFSVGTCFFALSVFVLRYDRKHGLNIYESTSYFRLLIAVVLQWMLVYLTSVAPSYVPLYVLIPFILTPGMGSGFALAFSGFDLVLFNLVNASDYNTFSYMIFQIVIGTVVSYILRETFKDEKRGVKLNLIFAMLIFMTKMYYIYNVEHYVSTMEFVDITVTALIFFLFGMYIYPIMIEFYRRERFALYRAILSRNSNFRQEIKSFSESDYIHALRVSYHSGRAAALLSLDIKCARAGGMYYRFGKIFDRDNSKAIKIMEDNCFPREVIDIVYEYNGIMRRPTTRESAIVHMVDSAITRLELLDGDTMQSSWNQDMVIYQIMNELSQKGLYDNSGLSMNQYLKVRDYLVNEDLLNTYSEE